MLVVYAFNKYFLPLTYNYKYYLLQPNLDKYGITILNWQIVAIQDEEMNTNIFAKLPKVNTGIIKDVTTEKNVKEKKTIPIHQSHETFENTSQIYVSR